MKKLFCPIVVLMLFIGLVSADGSPAFEEPKKPAKTSVLKSLAINRGLLSRFESEYAALVKDEKRAASDSARRQLVNIRYKIKALDEENERLTRSLPDTLQANEFLKDMLAKTEARHRPAFEAAPGTGARSQFRIEETLMPTTQEPATDLRPAGRALPFPSGMTNETPSDFSQAIRTPVLSAQVNVKEEAYRLHERALEYVAKKELMKAIKLYEEIVLMNPNDEEAYLIMGHCLVLTGNYERAEEIFQNAVHINPENVNQIAPFYENLAAQNPDDPDAYANLGFICLMLGNLNRAGEAFKEALSLNPQNPNALRGVRILENHTQ